MNSIVPQCISGRHTITVKRDPVDTDFTRSRLNLGPWSSNDQWTAARTYQLNLTKTPMTADQTDWYLPTDPTTITIEKVYTYLIFQPQTILVKDSTGAFQRINELSLLSHCPTVLLSATMGSLQKTINVGENCHIPARLPNAGDDIDLPLQFTKPGLLIYAGVSDLYKITQLYFMEEQPNYSIALEVSRYLQLDDGLNISTETALSTAEMAASPQL